MDASFYMSDVPSFRGNLAVATIFGICCCCQILAGFYFKQQRLLWLLFAGTAMETLGYVGRTWASKDHTNPSPYIMEAVCVGIAPGFLLSAVYYLVGQLVIILGQNLFGMCHETFEICLNGCNLLFTSLISVGIGVAINSSTEEALNQGITCMISGFSIQLATIIFAQLVWYSFLYRSSLSYTNMGNDSFEERHRSIRKGIHFRLYCLSISFCFTFFTIRTCYIISQLADGWVRSHLYYDQVYIMIFEALMMMLTCLLLTGFHPGFVFGRKELFKVNQSMKYFKQESKDPISARPFSYPNGPPDDLDPKERDHTNKVQKSELKDMIYSRLPIVHFIIRIVKKISK